VRILAMRICRSKNERPTICSFIKLSTRLATLRCTLGCARSMESGELQLNFSAAQSRISRCDTATRFPLRTLPPSMREGCRNPMVAC